MRSISLYMIVANDCAQRLKIGNGCACFAPTITYLHIKFITQNFNYQISNILLWAGPSIYCNN
jgi:hypothetical protein